MKNVVIVSHSKDAHAIYVTEKAKSKGVNVILLDTGIYPQNGQISINLFETNCLKIKSCNTSVSSEDINGIWWRRPLGSKSKTELSKIDKYMKSEGEVIIRSLYDFTSNSNWISDPNSTRLACRKPVQLMIARNIGFKIPLSCISNLKEDILKFMDVLKKEGKDLAIKPVGSAFMELTNLNDTEKRDRVVFTKKVDPRLILDHIDMVENCPVIFQEAIKKDFDLRVTVIDNIVYTIKISIEGCKECDNLDWRNYAGKRVYEPYNLPDEISQLCVDFTKSVGLRFGCIDLAFSNDEGYTFFEINPQGQWLPSELQFGYPIADQLIKSLVR
jgi:glutathione synthase/RimK-type ligase-like ATP-grasp enzyme